MRKSKREVRTVAIMALFSRKEGGLSLGLLQYSFYPLETFAPHPPPSKKNCSRFTVFKNEFVQRISKLAFLYVLIL
jgi:hypothetical protein